MDSARALDIGHAQQKNSRHQGALMRGPRVIESPSAGVDMAELNPQPIPPGRVRINITSEVAFDLEKMQKITAQVLEQLGCGGCHSGRVLDFVHLDEFVVNPKTLEVTNIGVGRGF
jgi:hypothetical protein